MAHHIDLRKSLWNYGSIQDVYCPIDICCRAESWLCQQKGRQMQDVIHLFALVFPSTADCVFPWKIFFTTNLPSVWDWSAFCRFEEFIFSLGGIATMKTTTRLRTRSQELTRTALHQREQSTAGKLNFQFSFCVPIRQKKKDKSKQKSGVRDGFFRDMRMGMML